LKKIDTVEQVLVRLRVAAPLWLIETTVGSQLWLEIKPLDVDVVLQVCRDVCLFFSNLLSM
jgi:hypothetical protein